MASSLCFQLHTCSQLRCIAAAKAAAAAAPSSVATANRTLSLLVKRPFLHSFCLPSGSSAELCERQQLRSPELVALEYADLNLSHKIFEDSGHVRIRQHVNPLSSSFSVPTPAPNWDEVFKDPTLPLMVDIGSGSGRFLLWLAKKHLDSRNFLGLEIRQKLVKRADVWVKELGFNNVHFMFANATISFKQIISSYPGPLMLVSILCPDPHFKKRHHKRRVLQKPLVDSIIDSLKPGGQVFIQSDVLEVAVDMRLWFDSVPNVLKHVDVLDQSLLCDKDGWLLNNPMGIRTEREIHAESEGANIYRRMYQKYVCI
ncbi:uncharacterized protein LOC111479752 [Cucurbita maxima]|uniref:tRNA (guanine(46)-N(7))-methyltransferase n=1 Tax=Cucurbita maxima TaxID=3661 RepID=A0A6J1ITE1_CUCMA|nr:uncharacterized protein LOC111479752 [Cucurbita maxima]